MSFAVCVFCSSSGAVDRQYLAAARELGASIARRRFTLVYDGADIGLMGALARAAHAEGGNVVGVIPERFQRKGIAYDAADELVVTADFRDRKAIMEQRADAFIALPGGFGTLEELLEILSLRHLRAHQKPVALVNTGQFFDPLLAMFERLYQGGFAKPEQRPAYRVAANPAEALDWVHNHPTRRSADQHPAEGR